MSRFPQSLAEKFVASVCFESSGKSFSFWITLITVDSFVAGVAHTISRHTESMSPTLRIDALGGRNVTLCALPAAKALAAPPGVLAVAAAQHGTRSCRETTGGNNPNYPHVHDHRFGLVQLCCLLVFYSKKTLHFLILCIPFYFLTKTSNLQLLSFQDHQGDHFVIRL